MTTIQITGSAWHKISEILSQTKNTYGLLYSVKTGGCNGFNFELNPLTKNIHQKIKDTKFLTILQNNNSSVYIDPLSEMYLLGTTIDYVKEDFTKKIYESKFIYNADKNLMTTCGCGISFSPKVVN
jgi:iron-sulfur cluster assembly accessory protein